LTRAKASTFNYVSHGEHATARRERVEVPGAEETDLHLIET